MRTGFAILCGCLVLAGVLWLLADPPASDRVDAVEGRSTNEAVPTPHLAPGHHGRDGAVAPDGEPVAAVRSDTPAASAAPATFGGVVVVGREREPVAGARIRLSAPTAEEIATTTAADGTFVFAEVPRDEELHLEVDAGATGRTTRARLRWAPGAKIEIVLPLLRSLSGRVVRVTRGGQKVGVPDVKLISKHMVGGSSGGISWSGFAKDGDGVVSGADGYFRYDGLSSWDGYLHVESEEWYLARGRRLWEDPDLPVEVRVHRRVPVAGTVVDPTGEAVAGVHVELDGQETKTGPDGCFRLEGIAVGTDGNLLVAEGAGVRRWMRVIAAPGTPVDGLVVRVAFTTWLEGTVVDEEGRPVEGVEVQAWRDRSGGAGHQEAFTDQAGHFRFEDLDTDTHELRLKKAGYELVIGRFVDVEPGGTTLEPVRLDRLVARDLRVVDAHGRPVPSATVSVSPWGSGSDVPVAKDGSFRALFPPWRAFTVTVEAPGFWPYSKHRMNPPPDEAWVVVLRRAHAIAGRVLDTRGYPVRGARVTCRGERYISSPYEGETDVNGGFRVEVPRAGAYDLEVYAYDRLFPPRPGVRTGTTDVVLRAVEGCWISGRLVDPDGCGISGVQVSAVPKEGGEAQYATTDAEGRFRIEDLLGGESRVEVGPHDDPLTERGLGVKHQVGVPAWTEDLVLEAEKLVSIAGTVVWKNGRPAIGVDVEATFEQAGPSPSMVTTDERGRFRFDEILPGTYAIEAWTWGEKESLYEAMAEGVSAGERGLELVLVLAEEEEEREEEEEEEEEEEGEEEDP